LDSQSNIAVGVVMGSASDWSTMKSCTDMLEQFNVSYEARVLSAHRTPTQTVEWVSSVEDREGKVIVAAAGGAAHLAGVVAAHTILPVLGVPMTGWALDGLDSLLSTVQMPRGIPVATLAIGKAGAVNAALLAVEIIALSDESMGAQMLEYRQEQQKAILGTTLE